jgi:hypothetical protein
MLGGEFIAADELEGWVRVIAATQPGANGLRFGELHVPPYSIPDHITLAGQACWYPGAYADQGRGAYGYLPPADNAFFFVGMVDEHRRMTRGVSLFAARVSTPWGEARVSDVCARAFDSVEVDPATGLVICRAQPGRTRVDWGFCDSVRKTGFCLMPSLLRWQAARRLARLFTASGDAASASRFRIEAARVQAAIPATFAQIVPRADGKREARLISATGLGRKDDTWASAYAVWLGVLPRDIEGAVARHLLALYEAGGTVVEGQVRHLPPGGDLGGFWEQAACEPGTYQNGGYWATPTGWWIVALGKISQPASQKLRREYLAHVRVHRDEGAPWEWIQPARDLRVNPHYGSSAALVYLSGKGALSSSR